MHFTVDQTRCESSSTSIMPEEVNYWSYGHQNLSQESISGYQDNNQSESNTFDFTEINRNKVGTGAKNKVTQEKRSRNKWINVNNNVEKSSKKKIKKAAKNDTLYIESLYENLSHEQLNNALHRDFHDDLVTHDFNLPMNMNLQMLIEFSAN